jgi:tyrosinase
VRVRKNQASLSAVEKQAFVAAVLALKANGTYDSYVQIHVDNVPSAHFGPAFCPWHREFLRRFELDLQAVDPTVTLPYWDWTVDDHPSASLWGPDLMGGDGDGPDGEVTTGPFASAGGHWPMPVGRVPYLTREMGRWVPTLPTAGDVTRVMAATRYDVPPWTTTETSGFRNPFEGWVPTSSAPNLHNRVHVWVGGAMAPMTSPNDPVFFLHHANVDRLWAQWQRANPTATYPISTGRPGHSLNDPMAPWGGGSTPASVLDHWALGYHYDSEDAMESPLPVGSILAYAGRGVYDVPVAWLPCDGATVGRARYPDLFSAIGTAHGAPYPDSFCVPDLRGRFPRGVAGGQATDPDASARSAPRPDLAPDGAGNAADQVGSIQPYATGASRAAMQAPIPLLPTGTHGAQSPAGAPDDICVVNLDSTTIAGGLTGGDSESRPRNKDVFYIIKAMSTGSVDAPAGALVGLAADDALALAPGWLLCDGASYDSTDARYAPLFAATNVAHGGSGVPDFCVPDLRGWFLRGVADTGSHDPDAETRSVARPDLPSGQQGNAGNRVGSSQQPATGLPRNQFSTVFPHLPDDGVHCWNSLGRPTGKTNWLGVDVSLTVSGGDNESRPVNTAVDWVIQTGPDASQVPIAAVVAYGGADPQSAAWVLCDGRPLDSGAYPELFEAIGTTYGAGTGAGTFRVPDYRGYFLRGVDPAAHVDPDAAARYAPGTALPVPAGTTPATGGAKVGTVQDWGTGIPNTPFRLTVPRLPNDREEVFSTVWDHAVGECDFDARVISTCTLGGDGETRPPNLDVVYLIRAQ